MYVLHLEMAATRVTVLCGILLQCFHLSSCSLAYMKYSNLKAINWGLPLAGHKFNVTPITTSKVTNHVKCMLECVKTEGCFAINVGSFQSGEHECEMLATNRYDIESMENFTARAGWTYVGPKTICDRNPCPKKELCIPHEARDDQYQCLDSRIISCRAPRALGMESGEISDDAMTASSFYGLRDEFIPGHGRLNTQEGGGSWAPALIAREKSWLQVDLGEQLSAVTGIATQGNYVHSAEGWTKSYTISYSHDQKKWTYYQESGSKKVFEANTDATSIVTHVFQIPILTRYMRVWPQSWKNFPAIRMENYGCRSL